jgi:hypothetical protein
MLKRLIFQRLVFYCKKGGFTMTNTEQLCLLAHLERLTTLVNWALDECLIEDDGLISSLDRELDIGKQLFREVNYV